MSKIDNEKNKLEKFDNLMYNPKWFTEKENEKFKNLTLINFLPFNRRVIVKPITTSAQTTGGIIISEVADKQFTGMVVAMSSDCRFLSEPGCDIKCGDFVLYSKHNESEIMIFGETFLMMSDFDIHGKVPAIDLFLDNLSTESDRLANIREKLVDNESVKFDKPNKY